MWGFKTSVRQAMLAALLLAAHPGAANPHVEFDSLSGVINLTNVSDAIVRLALNDPDTVQLRLLNSASARSMSLAVQESDAGLIILPRFPLRKGETYVFKVQTGSGVEIEDIITVAADKAPVPRLVSFSPGQRYIPANALRFYVTFSEPMAKGQVHRHIRLEFSDGAKVVSPFLNLQAELWDRNQRRLTLLLDPGRIKQGVGPNVEGEAPLQEGREYRLVVDGDMQSAQGTQLGASMYSSFSVNAPERRPIDAQNWTIVLPPAESVEPFFVSFDRIMDEGAVRRLLSISVLSGAAIVGTIKTDGTMWAITPERPWQRGIYTLVVQHDLEDVSGNTVRAPFDANSGTISATDTSPVVITAIIQ